MHYHQCPLSTSDKTPLTDITLILQRRKLKVRIMYCDSSLFKVEDSTKKKILCFWVCDDETNLSSLDLLKDSRQIYKCRVIFQAQFPGPGSPRVSRPLLIFLVPFLPEQFHVLKRSGMHRISLGWGFRMSRLRLARSTFQTGWIPSQITDRIFAW